MAFYYTFLPIIDGVFMTAGPSPALLVLYQVMWIIYVTCFLTFSFVVPLLPVPRKPKPRIRSNRIRKLWWFGRRKLPYHLVTDEENGGKIVMTQTGLIDRILDAVGLTSSATPKATPCLKKPLVKDEHGDPIQGSFSYSSILGMMLYLAGNTRPDIAYSVHSAARYAFAPKKSHEDALKRIGRYLLATRDKGMIITPNVDLKCLNVDAYPDSDFAGLYGYEDIHDPVVTRSRTGYVINVADSPVLWKSQLQTETATSTMEAEIVAMATCCRELFPILDMVKELSGAVGLKAEDGASMHIRLHEDNAGALILAQTLPPEYTPRSKHYAIKTNWFREQINIRGIKLLKCDTKEMLGDICTKCLPQPQFEYLRKKLMGW